GAPWARYDVPRAPDSTCGLPGAWRTERRSRLMLPLSMTTSFGDSPCLFPLVSLPAILRVDRNVPVDFRLTRKDVALSLVLLREGILYRHGDPSRRQLDTTRSARSGAACVIDEHAGFICDVKDRRILRYCPFCVGRQKCDGTGDCGRLPFVRCWIPRYGSE